MIELENIDKTYVTASVETRVLKRISFSVQKGEFLSIMGTSGTGKSTLMHILGCLDKPTDGHYRLDGTDMVSLNDDALSHLRNNKIGFVFQQFYLLDRATVLRNVMLPLIYTKEYPEDAKEQAEKLLAAVGLTERATYRPNQLSGGQQQRVAIARALINNPALVLADEPTGNLDSKSGADVLAVFQKLNREGRTIILVTHDRNVAEHANRIILLKDGMVAEDRVISSPLDADAESRAEAEKEMSK
ncbi:MAG: ABC transporter ATP-binding protein [Candidatus Omnitrophica bacterium]|nr:ABC transporter ATP-binding protein [Candidatus Omnitrophota bacterium]